MALKRVLCTEFDLDKHERNLSSMTTAHENLRLLHRSLGLLGFDNLNLIEKKYGNNYFLTSIDDYTYPYGCSLSY